jgi:hypothetical protein
LIRFFNPRIDEWEKHFGVENGVLYAKTPEGQVTIAIFRFNTPERVQYRQELVTNGLF